MGKVIVIGGGAAGMLAAGRAAEKGHTVILYEKNTILGKKLRITGKGRCNITNACDVEELLEHIPRNPYFLYSAFYTWDTERTVSFFESLSVATKVERGKRVFPVSDKAQDVAEALRSYLQRQKVKLCTGCPIQSIATEHGQVSGVFTSSGSFVPADAVIVATGGMSYPGTGSTGDGYRWAKQAGHTVTRLVPCLVPFRAKEDFCRDLMGVSLKNIAIQIKDEKKKVVYEDFGELLFTHYGVSGPVILSASSHIVDKAGTFTLFIDFKPALEEKALDSRLLRDFAKYSNREFKNALSDLLPQKCIPVIVRLSGIEETKKVNKITKEERRRLLRLLKALPVTLEGSTGFPEAVITRGGVSVEEVNPSTMESKKIKHLYFAGEILDVDGYTGGFNLQIAFSTGYLAGEKALHTQE